MTNNIKLKALGILAVVFICLFYLLPTLGVQTPAWMPSDKIRLGLDLQGGMHLILEVDVEKALASFLESSRQELYRRLREANIRAGQPESDQQSAISFTLLNPDDLAQVEDMAGRYFGDFALDSGVNAAGGQTLTLRMRPEAVKHHSEQASAQALETIRNRVDQFGVSEPEIIPQPGGQILIQLPGVRDPQRAIALIGKTAQLEFKLVDPSVDPSTATAVSLPQGAELSYVLNTDTTTGRATRQPIVLRSRASMTGETIDDARMNRDSGPLGQPYVSISFNPSGARQFAELTSQNVGRQLAIVLDGKVQSAPEIREPITGGEAMISGSFTPDEARDLAVVLRSGALPAPVTILEERTVGPSLGQDSISQGVTATILGGILVIIFMLVYYRLAGLAADIAVVLNILIILAVMVAMSATLTLPGIAGIILTIGMAVDANVLINERIREELRLGKTPAGAVENGYSRATITILDANITTILAALVLYQFGTGPIKGFAVTLSIGLASSMFTAIVVTRLMFDYCLTRFRPKRILI